MSKSLTSQDVYTTALLMLAAFGYSLNLLKLGDLVYSHMGVVSTTPDAAMLFFLEVTVRVAGVFPLIGVVAGWGVFLDSFHWG